MVRDRPAVIAAVPTPFTGTGDLDLAAAEALFRFTAAAGAELFVAGTTGEFPALDDAERSALIETALLAAGPERVVAHVGAPDARRAGRLAARAAALGVRRIAAITPHYLPARPDEIERYYKQVSEASGAADTYAYLFPERTGVVVDPEQLARIAEAAGLAGAKLSGGAALDLAGYTAAAPQLTIYSGDDGDLAACARAGAAGIVSGLSAAFPETFTALSAALESGDALGAQRHQRAVERIAATLGSSIGRLKLAVRLRGFGGSAARMTVDAPDPAAAEAIARLVADLAPGHAPSAASAPLR